MAIQRGLLSTIRSRSGRNSFSMLSVNLNLGHLGRFLRQTIGTFSVDADLTRTASVHCEALMERLTREDERIDACHAEIENCVSILSAFLDSSGEMQPQLPSTVVYEAHSLIGCMQEILQQHKLASLSFLKALWVASATPEVSTGMLAITLHRLGRAHAAMRMYAEAQKILQKSVAEYAAANVHRNHAVAVDAGELLSWVEKKLEREEQKLLSKRWSSASERTLSLIWEEDPTERRMSM